MFWIFETFNCMQIICIKNSYLTLQLFTKDFNCLQIVDIK